jgi:hypothetical protein
VYVRQKTIKGHVYYYLVEGRRVGGKVRQKVIRYLGKSASGIGSGGSGGGVPSPTPRNVPPPFTGFRDITTPVLEVLTGRHTVSKQYISDLTRSRGIRQAERDLITAVLADFPEGEVQVQEFADKMKAAILPLTSRTLEEEERYESISLPEDLRGPVAAYYEKIYQSPIKTSAGSVHFDDSIDSYFAHTRIEDLPVGTTRVIGKDIMGFPIYDIPSQADRTGGTRRVIEIQSDLFQKGRLDDEIFGNREDYSYQELYDAEDAFTQFVAKRQAVSQEEASAWIDEHHDTPSEEELRMEFIDERQAQDRQRICRLEPYRDTWYERIVGEEIKRAAREGNTLLQFPTGETAMKIEGLGESDGRWGTVRRDSFGSDLTADDLKVGLEISDSFVNDVPGTRWIITDVLEDGKFKAVPKHFVDEASAQSIGGESIEDTLAYVEQAFPNSAETFDISGNVDVTNPIYKFYEQRIQRCLKRIKPHLERVTDERGVTWFQVELTPADATKPVAAFGIARSSHSGS